MFSVTTRRTVETLVSTRRCEPLLLSSSQVKCTLTLRRWDPFCSSIDKIKEKEATERRKKKNKRAGRKRRVGKVHGVCCVCITYI